MQFDTSSARGSKYAIVFSVNDTILWHSVASSSQNLIPDSGLAVVNGSWVSVDAGRTWQSSSPYRGIRLNAIKKVCSPSPSQTLTRSQTQSSSQSQSLTASSSQSPSLTRTRTQTITLTSTSTQSASMTSTQTTSGFPMQSLMDNTLNSAWPISPSPIQVIGPDSWIALSFFMPEVDPVCGPGSYRIQSFVVPHSQ